MTLSFSTKWPAKMGDLAGQPNYFIEKIWTGFPCAELPFKYFDYYTSRDEYFDRFSKYWDGAWTENSETCFSSKLHTIRSGNRWKPGMKIHPVISNRTKDRFQFAPVLECKNVQEIEIRLIDLKKIRIFNVIIDGKELDSSEVSTLAINDGFPSVEAFFKWFDKDFIGQIVHWTDFKY